MDDKFSKLQNKIKLLEEQLEDKNIMIELLLSEIKKKRRNDDFETNKRNKMYDDLENHNFNINGYVDHDNNKIISSNELQNEKEIIVNKDKITDNTLTCNSTNNSANLKKNTENIKDNFNNNLNESLNEKNWVFKYKLKDDLDILLNKKKVTKIFRDNVFIDEFVEYCGDVFLIKSFDDFVNITLPKNLKKYLSENKQKIYKYLILNINNLSLNLICSTIILLSNEFSDYDKLIMIHDIILYTTIHSKILFIVFCLINSPDFFKNCKDDILKDTLFNILCFQYIIDIDIHKSKKITNQYTLIKNKLGLDTHKVLEDYLLNISCEIPVFNNYKFNDELYKYIYSVRVLGHFLDWDYTYNTYIIENLLKEVNPCKIVYMGILAISSLRLFGRIESNTLIFTYVKNLIKGYDDLSLVSYLIIKQVDENYSEKYISVYDTKIKEIGFDVEYLKKFILY